MNQHDAKALLPLVQALADGKTIQIRTNGAWTDIEDPEFGAPPEDYRVKPAEPREWYAKLPTDLGGPWIVPITPALQGDWSEWIRVREVLPEKEAGGNG